MDRPTAPASPDVLITGASGHLGEALMLTLTALGFHPLGVDIFPSATTHLVGSVADRNFVTGVIASNPSLRHILHTATLHVPHLRSHSIQDFIDINLTGTQNVLEAAQSLHDLESFILISTTNVFAPQSAEEPGLPAAWIDETFPPRPESIYTVTKRAAEDLCLLAHQSARLPIVVLRMSRFFAEADYDDSLRARFTNDNLKVLELSHRRCDIADAVAACHCAMLKAKEIGFDKFIIAAPTSFQNNPEVLELLGKDAAAALRQAVPEAEAAFRQCGWNYLDRVDRIYDSSKAVRNLGWQPIYTFTRAVKLISQGKEWKSDLWLRVGDKGYHPGSK